MVLRHTGLNTTDSALGEVQETAKPQHAICFVRLVHM